MPFPSTATARSAVPAGPDSAMLPSLDPPRHTMIRQLVNQAFTARNVGKLTDRLRQTAASIVDHVLDLGECDVVREISAEMSLQVIAEVLGIPPERKADFKRWSDAVVNGLSLSGVANDPKRGMSGAMEMWQYFNEVIEQRRAEPQDDLISRLITETAEHEEPLTTGELIMFCILLLLAGNETTTNLLGNILHTFAREPGVWDGLRSSPELIAGVIEESLRHDSPIQGFFRTVISPYTAHGVEIPVGDRVLLLYGAANRDPRHFPEPNEFRVERKPSDHLGFGSGIHLCLGAHLARMESAAVLRSLLERTRGFELAGDPVRGLNPNLRGVLTLPLNFAVH